MQTVNVWDRFVRVFHWSLVLAVIVQLITAEMFKSMHVAVGVLIALLVLARIGWGFVGSKHARFLDFIYPPREIIAYLKGLFGGNPKHYLGHNPAGGAMVMALLGVLLLTCFAGLKTFGAEGKGPLAHFDVGVVNTVCADEDRGENDHSVYRHDDGHSHDEAGGHGGVWKDIHESLVGVLLVLAGIHVCGVLASSYVHKENLIWSMLTGTKKGP